MCLTSPRPPSTNTRQTRPRRWNYEDIHENFENMLMVQERNALKRGCSACHKLEDENSRMQACAGCVRRIGFPAYYCDRACQRAAWHSHKFQCGEWNWIPVPENLGFRERRKAARKIERRIKAIRVVLSWACAMVFLNDPQLKRGGAGIRFCFKQSTNLLEPWVLEEVIVIGIDWTVPQYRNLMIGEDSFYQLSFGGVTMPLMPSLDSTSLCRHWTEYTSQWPWLVAQVCSMCNTSDWVAQQRLGHAIDVMSDANPRSPFKRWLNSFKAPTEIAIHPWRMSRYEEWQSKMGNVIFF